MPWVVSPDPHCAPEHTRIRGWAFNVATNLLPRLTSGSFGIGANLDSEQRKAFLGGFADHGPRRRFHDLMGAARDERDYLARIEAGLGTILGDKPTLTIYGEKNDPFGFQEKFRSYFDDIDEMVIPNGNHFPMADDPAGVAARIRAWQSGWSSRADRSASDSPATQSES